MTVSSMKYCKEFRKTRKYPKSKEKKAFHENCEKIYPFKIERLKNVNYITYGFSCYHQQEDDKLRIYFSVRYTNQEI